MWKLPLVFSSALSPLILPKPAALLTKFLALLTEFLGPQMAKNVTVTRQYNLVIESTGAWDSWGLSQLTACLWLRS